MSYWPLSIVTNCQLSRTVKCHAGVNTDTDIYHIHVYIIYDRHIIYIYEMTGDELLAAVTCTDGTVFRPRPPPSHITPPLTSHSPLPSNHLLPFHILRRRRRRMPADLLLSPPSPSSPPSPLPLTHELPSKPGRNKVLYSVPTSLPRREPGGVLQRRYCSGLW